MMSKHLPLLMALLAVAVTAGSCGRHRSGTADGISDAEEYVTDTMSLADERDELIALEPMPESADELFDDFIFNFASNHKLQMERTVFPLLVNSGSQGQHRIEAADWKMEHFFMHQGEYTLMFDSEKQMELVKDTSVTKVILEKIFLEDDFVRQYLFSKTAGRWMLEEIRNQTLPRNPNAHFVAFYHRFVTDSAFQRQSLAPEITFVGPDPDDDFSMTEGVITPDFWAAFAPDMPKSVLYNIVYGQQNPASTEKIFVIRGIANGLEIELTFRQEHGRWKLVKMME